MAQSTTSIAQTRARTKTIAYCGLAIAVTAACAWVTVPLGPVPFTLQTFAFAFILFALSPRQALIALAGYVVLGTIGIPVFSAMRGGIGVLAGPTGGFIWGAVIAGAIALSIKYGFDRLLGVAHKGTLRSAAQGVGAQHGGAQFRGAQSNGTSHDNSQHTDVRDNGTQIAGVRIGVKEFISCEISALVFLVLLYVAGWVQLMAVAHMGPAAAFASAVAPFIVLDLIKVTAGVLVAAAVRRAIQ